MRKGNNRFFPSLRFFLMFLSMGLVLDTCTSDAISVATDAVFHISLDEDHLYVGDTTPVHFLFTNRLGIAQPPQTAQWSSSDPQVLQVDAQGHLAAVGAGTATITAQVPGHPITQTLTVRVSNLASLDITTSTSSLPVKSQQQLTHHFQDVRGETQTSQPVQWSSDAPATIQVRPSGEITALGLGSATITLRTTDQGIVYTDTITLEVLPLEPTLQITNPIAMLQATQPAYQLRHAFTNDLGQLDAQQPVTWDSQHADILDVDPQEGHLELMANGTAIISVTTLFQDTPYQDAIEITVLGVDYTASIQGPPSMVVGDETILTNHFIQKHTQAAIIPDAVRWSTPHKAIMQVDPVSGDLTALQEGQATIVLTVTYQGNTYSAETTIHVTPAERWKLDIQALPSPWHLTEDSPVILDYSLIGSQGTDRTQEVGIQWSSSNPSVASFRDSQQGVLDLHQPGRVILTAQTVHEGTPYEATLQGLIIQTPTLAIINPPEQGQLNVHQPPHRLDYVYINESGQETRTDVVWVLLDDAPPSIVALDETRGTVQGLNPGQATITVQTTDGLEAEHPLRIRVVTYPYIQIISKLQEIPVGATASLDFVYWNEDRQRVDPSNVKVTWTSEDPAIEILDAITGRIQGMAVGQAAITVTTEQGVRSEPYILRVVAPPEEPNEGASSSDGATEKTPPEEEPSHEEDAEELREEDVDEATEDPEDLEDADEEKEEEEKNPPSPLPATHQPTFTITGAPQTLTIGDPYPLGFIYTNEQGHQEDTVAVDWDSRDPDKLSVSSSGVLDALAVGTVTIKATVNGLEDSVTITVVQDPTLAITDPPSNNTLHIRNGHTLSFVYTNQHGKTFPKNTGATVTWHSSDPAILTIDRNTGAITPQAVGQATITAQIDGGPRSDDLVLDIVQDVIQRIDNVPSQIHVTTTDHALGYTMKDALGKDLTGYTWTWSSSDETILGIGASSGILAPQPAGVGRSATITLTGTHPTGKAITKTTSAITVIQDRKLPISSSKNPLPIGEKATLSYVYTDSYGTTFPENTGTTVTWKSNDDRILTVDPNTGNVTAIALGKATITAQNNEGLTGFTQITVVQTPFVSIIVPPELPKEQINVDTQASGITLTFQAEDEHGNEPQGITWQWTSEQKNHLAIVKENDDSGALTPKRKGVGKTVTITLKAIQNGAPMNDYKDKVAIKVIQTPQLSIINLPPQKILKVPNSHPLDFSYENKNGKTNPRGNITWTSDDETILTVDPNNGEITAVAPGTATITAEIDGIFDSVDITVQKDPPPSDLLIWKPNPSNEKKTVIINPKYDGTKFIGETDDLDGTDYILVDDALLRKLISQGDHTFKCTTLVTNMKDLFLNKNVAESISHWDVSQVTTMQNMFAESNFNRPIGDWDVSSVTNMWSMFDGASSFNQDISGWEVGQVTNMDYMFSRASAFNQPIDKWDVSQVTKMFQMFNGASSFNQDISGWEVGNVTDMGSMFENATSFNQDLSSWDVDRVIGMASMFRGATSFNQDLSSWDVDRVTGMGYMFENATSFNQDLSGWNVGQCRSMEKMFKGASRFDQDLSDWDVGNVRACKEFANTLADSKQPNFTNCTK